MEEMANLPARVVVIKVVDTVAAVSAQKISIKEMHGSLFHVRKLVLDPKHSN